MNGQSQSAHQGKATNEIDAAIRDHFHSTAGDDREAAVSVSDKWTWAKALGVDLEVIDARLDKLCECKPPQDEYETVPRYRLKHGI